MASRGGVSERKLKALCDTIGHWQYKPAMKLVTGLLAKHPDSAYLFELQTNQKNFSKSCLKLRSMLLRLLHLAGTSNSGDRAVEAMMLAPFWIAALFPVQRYDSSHEENLLSDSLAIISDLLFASLNVVMSTTMAGPEVVVSGTVLEKIVKLSTEIMA